MIKIEKEVAICGWEAAIRGMRNPMNSWEKSDSSWGCDLGACGHCFGNDELDCIEKTYHVGPNDLSLMKKLANAGTDHRKFLRMIVVYADITAPLYWWKEYDTYKVGTVANSCSTMHKIHAKEFTLDDFSHEHLDGSIGLNELGSIIGYLNSMRGMYLSHKDKNYWWQMIQLLPSSYNQKRTVSLNYEVLANMYRSRQNHKLDEWVEFCKWCETLPYFKSIVLLEDD